MNKYPYFVKTKYPYERTFSLAANYIFIETQLMIASVFAEDDAKIASLYLYEIKPGLRLAQEMN